jgi:hypothetical protein
MARTEKIATDLANEELQNAWRYVQVSILDSRVERQRVVDETAGRLQASAGRLQVWLERNEALDNKLEGLQAQFSDAAVALQYDATKAQEQLASSRAWKHSMPCLGQRAHWIDCQKKYALDSRPCDPYLHELGKCVQGVVVTKSPSPPAAM